jgi:hypothetical protein
MRPSLRYTMLMSSLPHLPFMFAVRETPLSRLQLNRRLRMLEPEDTAILERIQAMMRWNRLSLEANDQQLVTNFQHLLIELNGRSCLQELVTTRFEQLTIVAALRRRHRGDSAPAHGLRWGHQRWVSHIEHHWTDPEFGLSKAFPWISDARRLLQADDPFGLERLLITVAWHHLGRASEGHYFDFEAVVIYALRFDLIEYWTGSDTATSKAHFQQLLQAGLGEYQDLFASSADDAVTRL